jgi:hypothetical protein
MPNAIMIIIKPLILFCLGKMNCLAGKHAWMAVSRSRIMGRGREYNYKCTRCHRLQYEKWI